MKKVLLLSLAVSLIVGLHSCRNSNQADSSQEHAQDLVVVEQSDSVRGTHEANNYCTVNITVDVPIDGPQVLVDSVMALINRELYYFCEYCVHETYTPDMISSRYNKNEAFTDAESLLSHYMGKYKTLIEDSLWNTLFSLELKLEAQTADFVTYGLEHYHCGASCGSEKQFFTFAKSDGHQIKGIISRDNLLRFIKDHPECPQDIKEHLGEDLWRKFPMDDSDNQFQNSNYGLLKDQFSLVVVGYENHYSLASYPYSEILPYLSAEAQQLVGQKSKD